MSRYVVTELEGYLNVAVGGDKHGPGLSVYVQDTASAGEVVATWRTEDMGGRDRRADRARARCRREARALADQLNAEDEEAA